jgi:ABC-type uncharacterized transport system auxiliary subunit
MAEDIVATSEVVRKGVQATREDMRMLSQRAQLLDMNRRQVLATQQFDYAVSLEAGNAASGVEALNTSLDEFLPELVKFCVEKGSDQPVDRRSRRY